MLFFGMKIFPLCATIILHILGKCCARKKMGKNLWVEKKTHEQNEKKTHIYACIMWRALATKIFSRKNNVIFFYQTLIVIFLVRLNNVIRNYYL